MNAGATLRNALEAIVRGDFLKKLKVDHYFLHVTYVLFLFALAIWFSLLIDRRLNVEVKNDEVLAEQKAVMTVQEFELAEFTRRTEVEAKLKSMGSKLGEPKKPAIRLK